MVSAVKLTEAAALVQEYMDGLNTSQFKCECCGRIAYSAVNENRLHQELGAIVHKLNRVAAGALKKENTTV